MPELPEVEVSRQGISPWLTGIKVTGADGVTRVVPLDVLLVFFGLSPKLGPIADWGLEIERKQLVVDTATFATSVPGIYAVGDINTYPGKKKLILCGFHEATLAAFAARRLQPMLDNTAHIVAIELLAAAQGIATACGAEYAGLDCFAVVASALPKPAAGERLLIAS